jgi:hypothetical protein
MADPFVMTCSLWPKYEPFANRQQHNDRPAAPTGLVALDILRRVVPAGCTS